MAELSDDLLLRRLRALGGPCDRNDAETEARRARFAEQLRRLHYDPVLRARIARIAAEVDVERFVYKPQDENVSDRD